jgi:hypothetical protein
MTTRHLAELAVAGSKPAFAALCRRYGEQGAIRACTHPEQAEEHDHRAHQADAARKISMTEHEDNHEPTNE